MVAQPLWGKSVLLENFYGLVANYLLIHIFFSLVGKVGLERESGCSNKGIVRVNKFLQASFFYNPVFSLRLVESKRDYSRGPKVFELINHLWKPWNTKK